MKKLRPTKTTECIRVQISHKNMAAISALQNKTGASLAKVMNALVEQALHQMDELTAARKANNQ